MDNCQADTLLRLPNLINPRLLSSTGSCQAKILSMLFHGIQIEELVFVSSDTKIRCLFSLRVWKLTKFTSFSRMDYKVTICLVTNQFMITQFPYSDIGIKLRSLNESCVERCRSHIRNVSENNT